MEEETVLPQLKNTTQHEGPAVVDHTFNPSTWEAEAGGSELETSLVHRVSSRPARATQRIPVSKKPKQNKAKQKNRSKPNQTKQVRVLQSLVKDRHEHLDLGW